MKTAKLNICWILLSFLVITTGCVEPFDPNESSGVVDFLVVDGFLDVSQQSCRISLSRTIPLDQQREIIAETGAVVSLEYQNGTRFALAEGEPGQYLAEGLPSDPNLEVRLRISTRQKEYLSSSVKPLLTPPIDSITYANDRIGVQVLVSTHDSESNSSFYIWDYTETWTYVSPFETSLAWNGRSVIQVEKENHRCWRTEPSTEIVIGSSSLETRELNSIRNFAITTIPWESAKIQERYSVLVEQRAIPREAFEYLDQLRNNTQNLGTLFDPLPSEPIGNITCLSAPDELVLGYFTASTVTSCRVFINERDLERPPESRSITGYESCILFEIERTEQYDQFRPVGETLPHMPRVGAYNYCIDCESLGGIAEKPAFW